MKSLAIVLILILLQASSCNREEPAIIKNNEGIITSKAPTWSTSISDNNQYAAGASNSIKYNTTVVIGSIENGKNGLTGINAKNGEKLWNWQDNFPNYTLDIYKFYLDNKYLSWEEGRNLYCLNLETGKTVWKNRFDLKDSPYFLNVTGFETEFYVNSYWPYDGYPKEAHIYKTSVKNGSLVEVVVLKSEEPNTNTEPSDLVVTKDNNGDKLLFFDSYTYKDNNDGKASINLYNLSKKEWVYKERPWFLNLVPSGGRTKILDGVVYMTAGSNVVALSLNDGEKVWFKQFEDKTHFVFSGFILVPEKNLIIFNAEGSGTTLYALDLTTGQTVWSEPSSGTSSHLQYLNGVVYFVGGGDGLLHAVDIDTGKHLWKISSPDLAVNSNAWFARYCAVFPGEDGKKGKVVVSSGLHAFAYEAER